MNRWLVALTVGALVLAAACGPRSTADGARATAPSGELTVFAAASLTDVFERIGSEFEAEHPGVTMVFSFAGSQQLATQIVEGAPADVFASASADHMDVVTGAGRITGEPATFATNRLDIAVEAGNPHGVAALDDLARAELKVVLAAAEVPVGRYTRQALDAAGVRVAPVSLETDVRAVLSKVALGEADAGIVYASDVAAADDRVDSVEISDEHNVLAGYPAATVAAAPNPRAADAFVAYLMTRQARATLRDHGFSTP